MAAFCSASTSQTSYLKLVEETKEQRIALIFSEVASVIAEQFPRGAKVLEAGCGVGLLGEALRNKGAEFEYHGVEPNITAAQICKEKGLSVFNGGLEDFRLVNSFDVVVFWAVFDHFMDPLAVAKKTLSLLRPGGIILIGNTNIAGFESEIMGPDSTHFTLPHRINFYSPEAMRVLLERAGFSDVQVSTTGQLDVEIVAEYWRNGGSYGLHPFLEKIVLGPPSVQTAFQEFLKQSSLAGYMQIRARR